MLFAQKRARGFYEKMGYVATGYEEDEEGCPHIMMKKEW
jgi:predicted GNAT family N-acyltransferase